MAVTEIKNPTPIEKDIEKKIEDRLFNGFNNWNGGYDGWLKWCDTLYEPDAHHTVHGHRLTLQQYKDMMGQLFQHYTMELGRFENMIIRDNRCDPPHRHGQEPRHRRGDAAEQHGVRHAQGGPRTHWRARGRGVGAVRHSARRPAVIRRAHGAADHGATPRARYRRRPDFRLPDMA